MDLMKRIAAALRKDGDIEVHPSAQDKALHVVHDGKVYKILAVEDKYFLDKLRKQAYLRQSDPARYEFNKARNPKTYLTSELIAAKHPELY
jgi:hypothetical protein